MRGAAVTAFALSLLTATAASACITCRPAVRAGIFDEHFWGRLSIAALPFLVILLVVAVLYRLAALPGDGEEQPG
jgi:hypothetical protein